MTHAAPHLLFGPEALERAVPRYTSYPTQPHFSETVDRATYARWLGEVPGGEPVELYVHIPFCERLCWYCACRTQALVSHASIDRYLAALERETAMVAERLGAGRRIVRIALGGGSPTILAAPDIRRLAGALARAFPAARSAPLHVEIDPRDIGAEKLDALVEAGMTSAALAVLDTDPDVQSAIGRRQDHALTRDTVARLRARGVGTVTLELLYGLPRQSVASVRRSIAAVAALAPERVALYGYAHVPWLARRQTMIDSRSLPEPAERRAQAEAARDDLIAAGYEPVGIDHFARPSDPLAAAAREGRLSRGFNGYAVGEGASLIGLGASAIGAVPQGYVQNEAVTATYLRLLEDGLLPVRRGHGLSLDDRVRRDAIGQILCSWSLDMKALAARYGDFAAPLAARAARLIEAAPEEVLTPWRGGFRLSPGAHAFAKLVAAEFDAYLPRGRGRHGLAV